MLKIFQSIKSGWHSGKANKLLKQGDDKKALIYYEKALSNTDNEGGQATLFECAAKAALLSGDNIKAISYLEKSLSIYEKLKNSNSFFQEPFDRVKNLLKQVDKSGK